MDGHDRVDARAVHRDDVVRIDRFEGGDGLGDDVVGGGSEVEAADDRMHLVDAARLLRLPHGVDHARVTARRDDDEPAVLHVVRGRVLAWKLSATRGTDGDSSGPPW